MLAMSVSLQETPQIHHALYYARMGWSVVPTHRVMRDAAGRPSCTCSSGATCISKGKHPALSSWTQFQREAASETQITEWFSGQYRDYGVGIITGAVSGIFVVDVDEGPGKPGPDTINNLQMINGDLPHTVEAKTGGGGRHVIMKHPGGEKWITTAKNVFGPGVDVRGDGGFIVAAPSMHESGRSYSWDETSSPRTTEIAEAPAWIIETATGEKPIVGQRNPSSGSGEILRDEWGKVTDGRERHMIGIICGVIAGRLRTTGVLPSVDDVVTEAWPTYERTTRARGASLDADGRGHDLMRQRTQHMLRRAESGKWKLAAQPSYRTDGVTYDPETGEILSDTTGQTGQQRDKKPRPAILSLTELDALPPPKWLIDGIFPEVGLVVPFGPPKSGKTFIVLSAGLHIAAGKDWFGKTVQQGAVVYIAGEGVGGLSQRIRAMRSHYHIDASVPFWIVPRAVNFRVEADVKALAKLVQDTVGDVPVRLVVIDTLARAMPGADENSAQEVGLVIAGCDWLRDELLCTIAPIHHSGKDEGKGARGTSALRGAWDAAFQIKAGHKSVTMTIADQKEAESGQSFVFDMVEVAVGIGRTSLVPVLRVDAGPTEQTTQAQPPSGLNGVALSVLLDIISGPEGGQLPPHPDMPLDVRGTRVESFRRTFYERLPTRSQDARQKAFVRAVDYLQQRRLIGMKDPWVWVA